MQDSLVFRRIDIGSFNGSYELALFDVGLPQETLVRAMREEPARMLTLYEAEHAPLDDVIAVVGLARDIGMPVRAVLPGMLKPAFASIVQITSVYITQPQWLVYQAHEVIYAPEYLTEATVPQLPPNAVGSLVIPHEAELSQIATAVKLFQGWRFDGTRKISRRLA